MSLILYFSAGKVFPRPWILLFRWDNLRHILAKCCSDCTRDRQKIIAKELAQFIIGKKIGFVGHSRSQELNLCFF